MSGLLHVFKYSYSGANKYKHVPSKNHIVVPTQEQESLQGLWRSLSHPQYFHQFYKHVHQMTPSMSWELALNLCPHSETGQFLI